MPASKWLKCPVTAISANSSKTVSVSVGEETGARDRVSAMYSCFPGMCTIIYWKQSIAGGTLGPLGGRESRDFLGEERGACGLSQLR